MFCASYRFVINTTTPDFEARFVKCWTAFSEYFQTDAGALGSHLHRIEEGEYCAYAQWPSEEIYLASREKAPNESFMALRLEWAALVEGTELLFEGEGVASV